MFEQVRHRHFGTVGNFLQNQTRQLENVKAKVSLVVSSPISKREMIAFVFPGLQHERERDERLCAKLFEGLLQPDDFLRGAHCCGGGSNGN